MYKCWTDRSSEHVVHQRSQTPPVYCSVVSASHQNLWGPETQRNNTLRTKQEPCGEKQSQEGPKKCTTCMYSMVPQKVWVTVPSWIDSLHSPKSVNFTWPVWKTTKNRMLMSTVMQRWEYMHSLILDKMKNINIDTTTKMFWVFFVLFFEPVLFSRATYSKEILMPFSDN